jgi:low affinity Fe/Cu permease
MATAASTTKSSGKRRTRSRLHLASSAISGQPAVSGEMRPFERFAAAVARLSGRPLTFSLAVAFIIAWAASGPLFGFSDTWQLVVNTSTTIITFLMVFLIQHTQNRDNLAIQIKLAELILVAKGAENELADAEERSEEYLEKLHAAYRRPLGRQR